MMDELGDLLADAIPCAMAIFLIAVALGMAAIPIALAWWLFSLVGIIGP
jgi:hypothetical protein